MAYDPSLLNIGRVKQLFVDDLVIESVENVARTWHEPKRANDQPLMKTDRPWEHVAYFTLAGWQVVRDPKDGLFKCWYQDWNKPEIKPGETAMGDSILNILYAESEDGINWRKPSLGIHKVEGHDTNIVIPNAYNVGILLDSQEDDPNKRWKMIFTRFLPGGDVCGVTAATSGDGIHWDELEDRPCMGRQGSRLDDVVLLRYDPFGRIYTMTTRSYDMYAVYRNLKSPELNHWTLPYYPLDWRRMNKRRIWQSESSDLLHWSEPYAILAPEDGEDGLDETYYGMFAFNAGNMTLGFLNIFPYVSNTMYARLVYSRNGKTWNHLNKRQAFLAPRGEGAWDAYMANITSAPIEMGDELWVYYGGSSNHHDWWCTGAREGVKAPEATDMSLVQYGLGLAKLRLDGYVSLDAGYERPGILITRCLISDGSNLQVNVCCKKEGSIAAEIVDVNDEVVPGFSRKECDVFTGDDVRHTFSWQGITDIPVFSTERAMYPYAEKERFRKIRFYMQNAELYSFTLE